MTEDDENIFTTCLESFSILSSFACDSCHICALIKAHYLLFSDKKNTFLAIDDVLMKKFAEWIFFQEIAKFYLNCGKNYGRLFVKTDEIHVTIWSTITEKIQFTANTSNEYWRRHFAYFLNHGEFLDTLRRTLEYRILPIKSLYEFCAKMSCYISNDEFCEFSDESVKIVGKLSNRKTKVERILNAPSIFPVTKHTKKSTTLKYNWLYELELFATTIRQEIGNQYLYDQEASI